MKRLFVVVSKDNSIQLQGLALNTNVFPSLNSSSVFLDAGGKEDVEMGSQNPGTVQAPAWMGGFLLVCRLPQLYTPLTERNGAYIDLTLISRGDGENSS